MNKKIIKTDKAPLPIGSYNQGTVSNGFIFTSGQIGIDPETGKIAQSNLKSEIHQIFKNLKNILLEGGSSIDKIVKLNVYIVDLNNFTCLNDILMKILNFDDRLRLLMSPITASLRFLK